MSDMKKTIGKIALVLAIVLVVSGVILAMKAYAEEAEKQKLNAEFYKKWSSA